MSKGLTQENIVALVELSPQGYAKIERGEVNPSVENLYKIAKVLEVDIDDLVRADQNAEGCIINKDNCLSGVQAINYYNESGELHLKLLGQKIEHLQEIIKQKNNEIEALKAIIDLLKK